MESGTLVIALDYPGAAFIYGATTPKVFVDGQQVPVPGWGTHAVPVAAGTHRIDVHIPYVFPRRAGKARTEITVRPDSEVRLDYMAPSFSLARGSLGTPGEQKSTGYSAVMIFNLLGVAAAVAGLLYLLSR